MKWSDPTDERPASSDPPRTAYHEVKNDVRDALASLGLRLVHEDGTEPGKSCFGFFCGSLFEASKLWHADDTTSGRGGRGRT